MKQCLPTFKDGKFEYCLEKQCELQDKLQDGDPAHLECWLCIFAYYDAKPDVTQMFTMKQIQAKRQSVNEI